MSSATSVRVPRTERCALFTESCAALQNYVIVKDLSDLRKIENKEGLPWTAYLGVCGMPGQTAHHGWVEFAHPKPGEVCFVSAASGAVGS